MCTYPQRILAAPGPSTYRNREELLNGARTGAEVYDLKTAKVISSEVRSNADYISVDIKVYSEQTSGYVQSMQTDWELDWQETNDGWMCQEVIAKRLGYRLVASGVPCQVREDSA